MMLAEDDLTMIADAARQWTASRSPLLESEPAFAREGGDAWQSMVDMGWTGAMIAEGYGGTAIGVAATARIMSELGRELITVPFLSTSVLAAELIERAGSEEQKALWLPQIVTGARFAVAIDAELQTPTSSADTLRAVRDGEGWVLSGEKPFVRDGDNAGHLLASARVGDQRLPELFVVSADTVRSATGLLADGSGIASFRFDGLRLPDSARLPSGAGPAFDQALTVARGLLAVEILATATRAFEITLEYLRERRQFGQPIGAFQALQHRAATIFVKVELARSCVDVAIRALETADPEAPRQVALACYQAKAAINLVSREMIQIHGGIGMTTANPAGLILKRARVLEILLGTADADAEWYAKARGV